MQQYKAQPKLNDFLRDNPNCNKEDYNTRFIGRKKDSHRKMKSAFNNSVFKPYRNQVDITLANRICPPIKK